MNDSTEILSLFDNKTLESNNNVSNDGVLAVLLDKFGEKLSSDAILAVCTKFNWNLEHCIDNLINLISEEKIGKSSNTENSEDVLVESEDSTFNSTQLSELEHDISNIELETKKMRENEPLTFAGAIKKTNRKFNNVIDTVDSSKPIRSNTKTRFYDRPEFRKIINEILEGIKVMVIMRGPPGCGKSFLAREIIDATTCDEYCNHIFSTDDFFYDHRGHYNFDASRLGEVHQSNKKRVSLSAHDGWSPIIVDNTNIKVWEMSSYIETAVRFGYVVHLVEPHTTWSRSASKLAMKNCHNVPKDSIERMMSNYELTTVQYAMESLGLKYKMPMPQYRQFPHIKSEKILKQNESGERTKDTSQGFVSKPQRVPKNIRILSDSESSPSQMPDVVQYESLEEAFQNIEIRNEWTTFEQERKQFWSNPTFQSPHLPQLQQLKSKEQRTPKKVSNVKAPTKDEIHSNLFAILKENHEHIEHKSSTDEGAINPKEKLVLHKHRKNCKNENHSFSQIREIYPSVPLEFLWDLFEKCEGDGDWTMDILLKEETRVGDYENLDSDKDRAKDDFDCNCDGLNASPPMEEILTGNASASYQTPKRDRSKINSDEHLAAKRMIEESFQIGDEHYSNHTRKIRNLRRGVNTPTIIESATNDDQEGACAIDADEPEQNDDEFLEVNLGMELVCQLDTVFGVEAYQRDAIKNMKTTIFMPKSLAQQLYALWIESIYNQLEEQRKKSIKEDAEFAKQLQSQENYPGLYKHAQPPSNLKDIMEMEYAWAAYKAEVDEWKSKTPQDLALQMTHDKLCNIFPDVDRDTLIEVLAAHNNKFTETVAVLKETLKVNEDKLLNEGRELIEEVRAEVEMNVRTSNFKPDLSLPVLSLETKKLGPEEAKRSALEEFEDSRNTAMLHTQLKAECYQKAKDAMNRGDASIALYYSQVANLHKTKIEVYNHKAANCISQVHNLNQNNPNMLDLHYLHVNEAVECLDIFIDKHITRLRAKPQTYKFIYVITGRGLHSANGIATIKQRVRIHILRVRQLSYSEVNPGLLKVKVYNTSSLSTDHRTF